MSTPEETSGVSATEKTGESERTSSSGKRPLINLVIGDLLVFLIFALVGRRSHGEPAGLDSLLQIVLTAAPFFIGWFLVAPFLGAFRRGLEKQPRVMVTRTLLAWVVACPVGLFLRWLFSGFTDFPPLSFAAITFVANLVLLILWRWPFALAQSMRKD